jgi:hypothetical protein
MADIHSVTSHVVGLARAVLRSFVVTVFVVALFGLVLAGLSFFFLREQPRVYGAAAVAVAIIESLVAGFFLGGKRAVVAAAAHGLGSMQSGRALVRLVFERIFGVAQGIEFGDRGGRITRGLERLPLAEAETLLGDAVRKATGDAQPSGRLRRMIQNRVLQAVQTYTLARFRAEGARHGGIDLLKVKEELERTVDDMIIRNVRAGLRFWTALTIIGLPVLIAAQTWLAVTFFEPSD